MRTSFPMFVLTKQGESWLMAAVQNTLTSGPRFLQLVTPSGSRSSSYRKFNPGLKSALMGLCPRGLPHKR